MGRTMGMFVGGCLHWVGLWACLWGVVLIRLIDAGGHSPAWVAAFPRQRVMRGTIVEKQN